MNDYAHHPTEIKATLSAIRAGFPDIERFHVVFQPHRYSRTRDCFVEFLEAFQACDNVIITDIYSAGESPIEEVSSEALVKAMKHPSCHYVKDPDAVIPGLVKSAKKGDLIACLGAGSIGSLGEKILTELER